MVLRRARARPEGFAAAAEITSTSMNSNMISMISSLADARLSHSVRRIRFIREALTMFPIGPMASGMLPWFGVVAAFAFILIVTIVV